MEDRTKTKEAITTVVREAGEPICFRELVRACRRIDPQLSYYSWVYGVALKELEVEGVVIVERDRRRDNRLSVRASW